MGIFPSMLSISAKLISRWQLQLNWVSLIPPTSLWPDRNRNRIFRAWFRFLLTGTGISKSKLRFLLTGTGISKCWYQPCILNYEYFCISISVFQYSFEFIFKWSLLQILVIFGIHSEFGFLLTGTGISESLFRFLITGTVIPAKTGILTKKIPY